MKTKGDQKQLTKRTRSSVPKRKEVVKQIKSSSRKSKPPVEYLSSGATVFDLALGGGYPLKRIFNLVGDASSGKTLLASEFIASARKILGKKLEWFYDDVEERYSFNTKKLYGFDMLKKDQENSYTIEDFQKKLKDKLSRLKEGKTLVYVLDSFDALTSEAELKKEKKKETSDKEKGSYGLDKQKNLGQFFRLRKTDIAKKKCILIIISQVRMNIGVMFGPRYYRTGGKAMDHWASTIAWLAEVEKHKKKGRAYGVTCKAQVTKVGNDKPFRECFIDIMFNYGVDDISSNIVFLYDLRTEKGKLKDKATKEKCIKWDGKEYSLRGLIKYIERHNLEEELKQRVIDKWNEIEDSISFTDRKSKY